MVSLATFQSLGNIFTLVYLIVCMGFFAKILQRLGFSPGWALVWIFPLVGVIGLYVLAFIRWPIRDAKESGFDQDLSVFD